MMRFPIGKKRQTNMFFSTIVYRLFLSLGVTTENAVFPFYKIHRRFDVGLPGGALILRLKSLPK